MQFPPPKIITNKIGGVEPLYQETYRTKKRQEQFSAAWEFVSQLSDSEWTVDDWKDFYTAISMAFVKITARHKKQKAKRMGTRGNNDIDE